MIKIIQKPISSQELSAFLGNPYSDMVKFVADVEKGILALGGELHADAEEVLLKAGSSQKNLWGANIYPGNPKESRLEYTSFINIRPAVKNYSNQIKDPKIREQIESIVKKLIP